MFNDWPIAEQENDSIPPPKHKLGVLFSIGDDSGSETETDDKETQTEVSSLQQVAVSDTEPRDLETCLEILKSEVSLIETVFYKTFFLVYNVQTRKFFSFKSTYEFFLLISSEVTVTATEVCFDYFNYIKKILAIKSCQNKAIFVVDHFSHK